MAKRWLYYYYWDNVNDKAVIVDAAPYRGPATKVGFVGPDYATMLGLYEQFFAKPIMHTTSKNFDNYRSR